jgi:hypothetical protein
MTPSAAARLDPVGRLRLPRRPALVRAALAAVLLLTAAAVLHTGPDPAPATGPDPALTGPDPADLTDPPDPDPDLATGPDPDLATGPDPDLATGPDPASPDPPGPERLAIPDGLVGVPVPLGDPARLSVLLPGDRVDLLAVPAAGGAPVALATGAPVLALDHAAATLLLAVTPEQGRAVVATPPTTTFAVIVRGPSGSG